MQQFDKLPLLIEENEGVYENMLNQLDPFSNTQSSYYKSLKILKTLIDKKYVEKDLMSNLREWISPQLVDKGANIDNLVFMLLTADDSDYLKEEMSHDWAYSVPKL